MRPQPHRASRLQRPGMLTMALIAMFTMMLSSLYLVGRTGVPQASYLVGWQALQPLGAFSSAGKGGGAVDAVDDQHLQGLVEGPSFPLDVYAPHVPNTVPLTAITIHDCKVWKTCRPPSTPEADGKLGKWVKVDRQLDPLKAYSTKGGGLLAQLSSLVSSKTIFYRRSRRLDVAHIVDIKLVHSGEEPPPASRGWKLIPEDMRSSGEKLFTLAKGELHMYTRSVGGEPDDSHQPSTTDGGALPNFSTGGGWGEKDPITEIDLVYGPNPPWPGFERIGRIAESERSLGRNQVDLIIRRKPQPAPEHKNLRFSTKGTFKILQLADLHLSVAQEPCREVEKSSCLSHNDTLDLMGKWLDAEKPDLVALTGDQLNGQDTSWDVQSVLPLVVQVLIDRKIPWAAILGNHDSESGDLTRRQQAVLLANLPYSYTYAGPANLHDNTGACNFYLRLLAPNKQNPAHLFSLYFLDSGINAPGFKWSFGKSKEYDYVRTDQINWLLGKSEDVKTLSRPYKPELAKDVDTTWKRTNKPAPRRERSDGETGERTPVEVRKKPAAMAFIHIPVPEAFDPVDKDEQGKDRILGQRLETATTQGAQKQRGVFDALLQQHDRDIQVLVHGHMHNNEDCRRVKGIWICFGGGSSYAGYGKVGFDRRARVFEISQWGERIETWHVLESDPSKQVDRLTLYPSS